MILLELAQDNARGLMDRTAFAPGTAGMLFVFPAMTTSAFWNERTHLPLDLALVSFQPSAFSDQLQDKTRLPPRSLARTRARSLEASRQYFRLALRPAAAAAGEEETSASLFAARGSLVGRSLDVLEILPMRTLSETGRPETYAPSRPYVIAVEAARGLLEAHGIGPGSNVALTLLPGPPGLPGLRRVLLTRRA